MSAVDLMNNIVAHSVRGMPADAAFVTNMADFSMELFKKSIKAGQNSLISPLSVTLTLSMVANGADGETLAQLTALLSGDIPLAERNEYLYSYAKSLPSMVKSKLRIANSLWLRDDGDSLQVQVDFLQKNADYYSAAAFRTAFNDRTVRDINNWVKSNTEGMIDQILDEIKELDMLVLINAVVFEAEWKNVYFKGDVWKADFTDINGTVRNVEFMYSTESGYLDDGRATGFIKPYANGGYSFVALLPNEGISIENYIASLSGAVLLDTLTNRRQKALVLASMPKFRYTYSAKMNDALKSLGIRDAFDKDMADFRGMATTSFGNGNLYISEVLHKAYISVDELGTKAGAVNSAVMTARGLPEIPKIVNLDRPFVYMIIDNATDLPVFVGTLMTV